MQWSVPLKSIIAIQFLFLFLKKAMFISINPKFIEINDILFKWQTISESATTTSFKKPAALPFIVLTQHVFESKTQITDCIYKGWWHLKCPLSPPMIYAVTVWSEFKLDMNSILMISCAYTVYFYLPYYNEQDLCFYTRKASRWSKTCILNKKVFSSFGPL